MIRTQIAGLIVFCVAGKWRVISWTIIFKLLAICWSMDERTNGRTDGWLVGAQICASLHNTGFDDMSSVAVVVLLEPQVPRQFVPQPLGASL